MKKILYLFLLIFTFSSCNLDETPYTVSEENLKDSPDGAELYIIGTYNTFWSSYMMKKTYMEWIDMDHDHAAAEGWVVSGAGMGNVTTHWGYNGGSDMFMVFYLIINRANFAMENIPHHTSISDDEKDQLIGEALFLRAFAYYHLVRMYGGVPLRLEYSTPRDMARSSVEDVYNQIVLDLKEATLLMKEKGMNSAKWGITNGTASRLLLAKVYATMASGALAGKESMIVDIKGTETTFQTDAVAGHENIDPKYCYEQVKAICDELISERGVHFDLRNNFQSIWGGENKRNNEFVWGIVGHEDYKVEHLNYYYSAIPFGGRAWAGISKHLYDLYEKDDNRALYGIFHYVKRALDSKNFERYPDDPKYATGPDGKATTFTNYTGFLSPTKWYLGDVTDPAPEAVQGVYKAQDIPMLRYAEVYLLRAEALNELGKPVEALADLDVIRERADASIKSGTTSDKLQIRSLIFQERALEFAQEFNRKFDLLRWGLYIKVMNKTETVPVRYGNVISKIREPRSILYAVPTSETTVNKLFGPNNTGW